jgi:hypothetical protein
VSEKNSAIVWAGVIGGVGFGQQSIGAAIFMVVLLVVVVGYLAEQGGRV